MAATIYKAAVSLFVDFDSIYFQVLSPPFSAFRVNAAQNFPYKWLSDLIGMHLAFCWKGRLKSFDNFIISLDCCCQFDTPFASTSHLPSPVSTCRIVAR